MCDSVIILSPGEARVQGCRIMELEVKRADDATTLKDFNHVRIKPRRVTLVLASLLPQPPARPARLPPYSYN